MNETWSLDALYKGYDDPSFQKDLQKLEQLHEEGIALSNHLSHDNEQLTLEKIILFGQQQTTLQTRLYVYVNLRQTVDTTNSETVSYLNKLEKSFSNSAKIDAKLNRYMAEVTTLEDCLKESQLLQEHQYYVMKKKEDGKHLLSDDVEEVMSKMNISGGNAWAMMYDYLTSTLEVEFKGDKTTLPMIRNLAYNEDKDVRKAAYEAELASFDKIKDAIAFSLNNIKAQVLTECELRHYDSPLAMTLAQSRMKQDTLDAMLEAMEEYMPVFHKYLRRKAEMLGYTNGLPWYELFAPMGESNEKFTTDSAKSYLIKHFQPFAPDMADMIERAFDEEWIDFFPRKGKVGGAFCQNLSFLKQSRILTNFDGSLGDVITLAHELGHAYHGMMIENHSILNTDYSMPVAETASTFNENIIMNAAIEEAQGNEKIALIENQLQDLTQIMCDIYSRFLFEKEVFERRKNDFLMPSDLEEIMLKAQKKAYGNGLDPNYLHSYMWVVKGHYYSAGLSFYNFPYAFGGLFARGLIVKYQELKDEFVPKYRKLLHATTIQDVEEVASIADIDLTSKDFWVSALQTAEKRINEFLSLTE